MVVSSDGNDVKFQQFVGSTGRKQILWYLNIKIIDKNL